MERLVAKRKLQHRVYGRQPSENTSQQRHVFRPRHESGLAMRSADLQSAADVWLAVLNDASKNQLACAARSPMPGCGAADAQAGYLWNLVKIHESGHAFAKATEHQTSIGGWFSPTSRGSRAKDDIRWFHLSLQREEVEEFLPMRSSLQASFGMSVQSYWVCLIARWRSLALSC